MLTLDNRHLKSGDWHRTVYINTLGEGTTEFDLDYGPKRNLEASGRAGTENISISTTRTPPTTGSRISVLGQMGADDYLPAQ